MAERGDVAPEVVGSSPVSSTMSTNELCAVCGGRIWMAHLYMSGPVYVHVPRGPNYQYDHGAKPSDG